jgi:hypothetical protein
MVIEDPKAVVHGSVGWLQVAHVYSDDLEPDYVIYENNAIEQFRFSFHLRKCC